MSILDQLGINHTVFFQLIIFLFSITTMSILVMKPYLNALALRETKTKGGEAQAAEIIKRSAELRTQYESKARQVRDQIRTIYDTFREQANAETQILLDSARLESNRLIEDTRKQTSAQIGEALKKVQEQIPQLAQSILHKLLAKNSRAN